MNSYNSLTDYYPVFMEIGTEPVMLNAEQLINKAQSSCFNVFQTAVLLSKNCFEGFVYLTFEIKPEQLFTQGTILLKEKPEFMLLNFYKLIEEFKPGLLIQFEILLNGRQQDFFGVSPEKLLFIILENHLIRFPVSIFSSIDIRSFIGNNLTQNTSKQWFKLLLLGERFAVEFDLIERINHIYNENYKQFGDEIRLKLEILDLYKRKLMLASKSDVKTENELDELMYQNLVHAKLNGTSEHIFNLSRANQQNSEALLPVHQQIRAWSKKIYRAISKNSSEIQTNTDENIDYEELTELFLRANTLYNMPVSGISDVFLINAQLVLLLSKVTVFRKTRGLPVTDGFLLKTDTDEEELSKIDLRSLERNLKELLVANRLENFTEYKMKFTLDDYEMMNLHQNHLAQELKYIDKQISQIQIDIKSVLQIKMQTKKV